jgi:hypothetical protein
MAHTTRAPRSLMSPVGDTPAAGVLLQETAAVDDPEPRPDRPLRIN